MPASKRKSATAASAETTAEITRSTVPATIEQAPPEGGGRPPAGHVHDETAGGDGAPAGIAGGK